MAVHLMPLWLLFVLTIVFFVISIDLGYKLGKSKRFRSANEKEASISVATEAILGLLAFLLVFCFNIVYNRYDSKKEMVREEANLIRTTWTRSDFLPVKDLREAKLLLKKYVDIRLVIASTDDVDSVKYYLNESNEIQNKLWIMAVVNGRKDLNSDVAALYIESLNEIFNIHNSRIDVGLNARIPLSIWGLLYLLAFLSMFSFGYFTAIANSTRRSWVLSIMVISFSLVLILVASLDRTESGFIMINQNPLVELRSWMNTDREAPPVPADTINWKPVFEKAE